jgi:hypothetical protein
MDDQAKAAVLAAISARSKEPFSDGELYYPAIDSVQIIYEGTLEDSSARKLLVELQFRGLRVRHGEVGGRAQGLLARSGAEFVGQPTFAKD